MSSAPPAQTPPRGSSPSADQELERLLAKVGDMSFRRRVVTSLDWLDVRPEHRVLDAGCGEGFHAMVLARVVGCRVEGIDADARIVGQGRRWLADEPGVELRLGDLTAIDAEDGAYDRILCSEVLEHLPDDAAAVSELMRVLAPGGRLVVTVPHRNYPFLWDPLNWTRERAGLGHFNPSNGWIGGIWALDHQRLYRPGDLRGLLEGGGFDVRAMAGLTRAGIPFNCLVLQVGKKVLSASATPAPLRAGAEKFALDAELPSRHPFGAALGLLRRVDRRNDRSIPASGPALNLIAAADKPLAPR